MKRGPGVCAHRVPFQELKAIMPIIPNEQDYEAVEREHGPLRPNATVKEQAERYRLAQANKLIRLTQPKPRNAPQKQGR